MRRRRWLWFYIVLMLILLYSPFSYGAVSEAETAAKELQTLGLFQGTERGYELGRDATREEAVAMLVRLLGKENEAYQGQWEHPFTDVSRWAQPYVSYAYANGLTQGVNATTFGSNEKITQSQYLTFLLRALGYNSLTDFTWAAPYELAHTIGLIPAGPWENDAFQRQDMVILSRDALKIGRKSDGIYLLKALYQEGAVEENAIRSLGWSYLLTEPSLREESSFLIGGKLVSLGMSESDLRQAFGTPSERMPSIQGHTWFAYHTVDYSDFFMAGVKDGQVVALYANSYGFSHCGNGLDDEDTVGSQYNGGLGGFYIRYYQDNANYDRIHAISLELAGQEKAVYTPETLAGEARACFHVTNSFRVANGFDPLVWDSAVAEVATGYSASMAENDFFSHTGIDGSNIGKRLTDGGVKWTLCGENIAAGYYDIGTVHNGWVNSPGHRANLLRDRFQYMGVGLYHISTGSYRVYWTQNFYEG